MGREQIRVVVKTFVLDIKTKKPHTVKHDAFLCGARSSALGDLLALLVDGRSLAFVVDHDDEVLVGAEAGALGALVHRCLIVLVAGRETVDSLEGDGVVHHEAEPAGGLL